MASLPPPSIKQRVVVAPPGQPALLDLLVIFSGNLLRAMRVNFPLLDGCGYTISNQFLQPATNIDIYPIRSSPPSFNIPPSENKKQPENRSMQGTILQPTRIAHHTLRTPTTQVAGKPSSARVEEQRQESRALSLSPETLDTYGNSGHQGSQAPLPPPPRK